MLNTNQVSPIAARDTIPCSAPDGCSDDDITFESMMSYESDDICDADILRRLYVEFTSIAEET